MHYIKGFYHVIRPSFLRDLFFLRFIALQFYGMPIMTSQKISHRFPMGFFLGLLMIDFSKLFFYNIILLQLILWTSFGFLLSGFSVFSYTISYGFSAHDVFQNFISYGFSHGFPQTFFCRKSKESTRGPPRKKKRDLRKKCQGDPQEKCRKIQEIYRNCQGDPQYLKTYYYYYHHYLFLFCSSVLWGRQGQK